MLALSHDYCKHFVRLPLNQFMLIVSQRDHITATALKNIALLPIKKMANNLKLNTYIYKKKMGVREKKNFAQGQRKKQWRNVFETVE